MMISLKTHDGLHYLCAEPDGRVVADRTAVGEWEQWTVVTVRPGVIGLRSAHGRFLSAQPDGSVVADREHLNVWEEWAIDLTPDGGVGLHGAHGRYLVAEEGGGGEVRANRDGLGPWETFTPSGPLGVVPAPLRRVVGRLRLDPRHAFRDDAGFLNPTYAHSGDLFSVFVRDAARALGELDAVAAAGFHGLRVWITLGCGPNTARGCHPSDYWYRREVGPDVTPDYWGHLRAFRDALVARGLRLVASQGDLSQLRDRRAFMERLAALDTESPFVDFVDGGNEMWQNGEPDPAKLAQFVRWYADAGGQALKTLTDAPLYGPDAPPPPQQFDTWSIPPADLFDVHSFRGGNSWDKRRHIWGYTYPGHGAPAKKNGINSEPPGGGARVSAIENAHEMDDEAVALLALASHLGRQAFVWFSGEGVILDAGLRTEPGFAAVPRAVALLPEDVQTFETQTHSEPNAAGRQRVLESDAPKGVRIDGRIAHDGRFAFTIDGPPGTYSLRVARSFDGHLYHPGTAEGIEVHAAAGDWITVAFTRGRLLVGRVR